MLIKKIEPLLRGQLRYMFSGFSKVNLSQDSEKIEDVFDLNNRMQIKKRSKVQQVIDRENQEDLVDIQRDEKYAHYSQLEINFAAETYGHKCVLASMKEFQFSLLPLICGGAFAFSALTSIPYMISYPSIFAHTAGLALSYFFIVSRWRLRSCPQIKAIYQCIATGKLTIHYSLQSKPADRYSSVFAKVGDQQTSTAILNSKRPLGVSSVEIEHKTTVARQEIRHSKRSGTNGVFEVDQKDFTYGVRLGNSYSLLIEKYTDVIWCRVKGELLWIEEDGLQTNTRLFSELLK